MHSAAADDFSLRRVKLRVIMVGLEAKAIRNATKLLEIVRSMSFAFRSRESCVEIAIFAEKKATHLPPTQLSRKILAVFSFPSKLDVLSSGYDFQTINL